MSTSTPFAAKPHLVLAGVFLAVLAPLALAQTKPNVTVVNTTANPVPVIGTVTGQVTGSVSATQSGTWNVGITGTPTVAISGSVMTHSEERPADTAVQFELELDCDSESYTVPAGNRLVLEFVSTSAVSLAGGSDPALVLAIITRLNGQLNAHYLTLDKQVVDNGGHPFSVLSSFKPLIAYADEGTEVCYRRNFLVGGPITLSSVNFSGYLVAQP